MAEVNNERGGDDGGKTPTGSVSIPRVVRFAFVNFRSVGGKWFACCESCSKELVDKAGVTTAFTK